MVEKRIRKCTAIVSISIKGETIQEAEDTARALVFPPIQQAAAAKGLPFVHLRVVRLGGPIVKNMPATFTSDEPGRYPVTVDVYWEEEGLWQWNDPWQGMDSWIRAAIEDIPDIRFIYSRVAPTFTS